MRPDLSNKPNSNTEKINDRYRACNNAGSDLEILHRRILRRNRLMRPICLFA